MDYSFSRYLAAKKSVDDRALNQHVWQTLTHALPSGIPDKPLRILETGCGIGTMIERMVEWKLFTHAEYIGLDSQVENINIAPRRLKEWAAKSGYGWCEDPSGGFMIQRESQSLAVRLIEADLFDFFARRQETETWDLVVAHAFLDLMDIPRTLPELLQCLEKGGLFYFTLNFDGLTLFEPPLDPSLDERIEHLYHRTMDERRTDGSPSGDSQAGRHLFANLKEAGAVILDAGASDWVVYPTAVGYLHDEAYFLHHILDTIQGALHDHPELDPVRFAEWVAERHMQVDRCELVYVAHQVDFVGVFEPRRLG